MTKIVLRPTERTVVVYINHVEVRATPLDVVLHAARLPTLFTDDRLVKSPTGGTEAAALIVDEAVELVIPAALLTPLIDALIEHRDRITGLVVGNERRLQ